MLCTGYPREDLDQKDHEVDGFGNSPNRAPKFTPRTESELHISGAGTPRSLSDIAETAAGTFGKELSMASVMTGNTDFTSGGSVRNAGKIVGRRKRMANGPRGVYKHLTEEVRRQGWAVLQLVWPSWASGFDREQIVRFAALAARDATRWVLNAKRAGPVALVGWGSAATAAVEAGARLNWDHGRGAVDVVATLTQPSDGMHLAGQPTLPLSEAALEKVHRTRVLTMSGAEDYCAEATHGLGGVLQRQAHVTALTRELAAASAARGASAGAGASAVGKAAEAFADLKDARPWKVALKSAGWMQLQSRMGTTLQTGQRELLQPGEDGKTWRPRAS